MRAGVARDGQAYPAGMPQHWGMSAALRGASRLASAAMRKVNSPFAQPARRVADTRHTGSHMQDPMIEYMHGAAVAPISPSHRGRTGWSLGGPPGEPEHPQQ